ncbi:MAG: right-handed parallel beta-helix repeat-containing protein [Flavobacteriales bacterium]|nr:right-handed parallel beta-helix repeat-containing protein [Flavobacteriales bacterium]
MSSGTCIGVNDEGGGDAVYNIQVLNNRFDRVYRNALKMTSAHADVIGNVLHDIGTIPGQSGQDFLGNTAIKCQGDDALVQGNRIQFVGGSGITAGGQRTEAGRALVINNYIDSALVMLNDHAAITFDQSDGLTIRDNIIAGMVPSAEKSATNGQSSDRSVGIYFGFDNIVDTRVVHNTITGCGTGILVDHEPGYTGNVVDSNTVFNCRGTQMAIQDLGTLGSTYQSLYDTRYEHNILYCLGAEQTCLAQDQVKADSYAGTERLVNFGKFSANHYYNPFNEVIVRQNVYYTTANTDFLGPREIPWTLRGWQAATGQDLNSYTSPLHGKDYSILVEDTIPPSGLADDNISGTLGDWTGGCGAATTVQEGSNDILRSPNCVFVERYCPECADLDDSDSTHLGTHVFRFRMKADGVDAMRLAATYDDEFRFRDVAYFGVTPEWREYELVAEVTPGGTNTDHRVTAFQNMQYALDAISSSTIYLDDVSVRKCELAPDYFDEVIALETSYSQLRSPGTEADPRNMEEFTWTVAGAMCTATSIRTRYRSIPGEYCPLQAQHAVCQPAA